MGASPVEGSVASAVKLKEKASLWKPDGRKKVQFISKVFLRKESTSIQLSTSKIYHVEVIDHCQNSMTYRTASADPKGSTN